MILAVVVLAYLGPGASMSQIEYRGENIKLSRAYLDYDDYKNDPNNIDPSETVRVQKMVSEAPIAASFDDRMQMVRAIFDVRFPGYGVSGFGEEPQSDGTALAGFALEIPRAGKDRFLTFRRQMGVYTLIDDFIAASDLGILRVSAAGGELAYGDRDGKRVLVRPPSNPR